MKVYFLPFASGMPLSLGAIFIYFVSLGEVDTTIDFRTVVIGLGFESP